MSLDVAPLGELTAEFMDALDDEFGDDIELGVHAVVVEVTKPSSDDADGWTGVLYRCSDERRWIQRGFFSAALAAAEDTAEEVDPEDE